MMKISTKMTMMSRLVLAALLMVVAFSLAVIFFLNNLESKQNKVAADQLVNKKQVLLNQLDLWIVENTRSLSLLAKNDIFLGVESEYQSKQLQFFVETYPWVSVAFMTDAEGNALVRSDNKTLRSYKDREYIQQVISGEASGQQILIGKVKPMLLQCLSLPVLNDVGVLKIITQCSSLGYIQESIAAGNFGKTGHAFLLDEKQRLLAYGDGSDISASLQDFSQSSLLQNDALLDINISNDQVGGVEVDGIKRVVTWSTLSNNWTLVVMQDYQEAYKDYLAIKQYAVVAVFVFVFTLLLLILWLRSVVILPLKVLKQTADDFSQGRFNEEAAYSYREDELGDMAKGLDRLGVCLRMALKHIRSF